jgi:hypothetical protein
MRLMVIRSRFAKLKGWGDSLLPLLPNRPRFCVRDDLGLTQRYSGALVEVATNSGI